MNEEEQTDFIIESGDWYLSNYCYPMKLYHWKHRTIVGDEYTFEMRRFSNDGNTIIEEVCRWEHENKKLFDGYIHNSDDLEAITRLLDLENL